MRCRVLILFVALAVIGSYGVSHAADETLWSVDIQGVGGPMYNQLDPPVLMQGLEPQYGYGNIWNAFNVPGHDLPATVNPSMELVDSEGNPTSVTFTVTGNVSGFSYDDVVPLIQDYLFVNAGNSDASVTWAISGLRAGGSYDLYAYGGIIRDVSITVDTDGDGSLSDETATIVPAGGFLFEGIKADSSGTIIGRAAPGTVTEGNWGGFQLREALLASRPDPPDGADNVLLALVQWKAGGTAQFHDVYFGTDPDALEFVAHYPRVQTVYYHMPGITPGTTYYWRIDEVEADGTTIHTGNVWSFTAAPLAAYSPDPPDGAEYVAADSVLSWVPGSTAFSHDVYFGTDETDVADGTGGTSKGNQPTTTFDPGILQLGTTYYWRIDEVEDDGTTKHRGEVWSFTTLPDILITDPNLVAWWKLDEGEGTTVLDWSGHGHHGELRGDARWVAGYDGGALDLDGSGDYVDFGNPADLPSGTSARSLCGWGKTDRVSAGYRWIAAYGSPALGEAMFIGLNADDLIGGGYLGDDVFVYDFWQVDVWHHLCLTYDGAMARVYVDGIELASEAKDWNLTLSRVRIGRQVNDGAEFWDGLVDDVRIYDKALTVDEIKQAMRGDPRLAWDPKPSAGALVDIEHATPLSWSPGEKAAKHDVYFGTDADAVSDADASDTTGVYRGRQDFNSYTPPEALVWGQTYYWRVDEYNTDATISEGRLWDFTVTGYLIVDDFEDYDDYCNRIFYAWTDGWGYSADPACGVTASAGNGTGSTVGNLSFPYAEQTIVHGGRQSMPFEYNNTGTGGKARYSEAQREWASPQDWTRKAVKALTLYFYGDPANAAEQLYVALEDTAGQVRVVNHPDLEAVQAAGWQEWNIALTQFSGVNLTAVKKLYIGLGNRVSPAAAGTGKIYIDDIRLYRPRCVPSLAKPAEDLSGNCIVDYADVEIVSDQWLDSGFIVTPVDPGTTGLIAHYPLNGNADDVVGGHNGTTTGVVSYTTGNVGQAIQLDGVDDYVDCGTDPVFNIPTNITVACWIKVLQFDKTWQAIVTKGDNSWRLHRSGTSNNIAWGTSGLTPTDITGSVNVNDGQWHHVAGVYDGTQKRLYVDGNLDASSNSTGNIDTSDYSVYIGENAQATGRYWTGLIDEVRVYSHALSGAEVAWLAGRTSPFSIPADLHQDDVIDFKDLAVLGDSWLEEILWP